MEKTKKALVVILVLVIGTMSLFIGCTSTTLIKDEHIVPPDPNNPYQGTWLSIGEQNMMLVIKGMNATWYVLDQRIYGVPLQWKKANVYEVDSTWILSEDKNILTSGLLAGGFKFERYVKQ